MSTPPPTPPSVAPGAAGSAQPGEAASAQARKPPLSGCVTALLIAFGAVMVIGVPTLGILAAIAIPAYQAYSVRARITAAHAATGPIRNDIDAWRNSHGACPDQQWLDSRRTPAGTAISHMQMTASSTGRCALQIMLDVPARGGYPAFFFLESTETGWRCRAGSIPVEQLPASCTTVQGSATP